MPLGSILLAFAWTALQGEVTLGNFLTGYAVGFAILAMLDRGGVVPSSVARRTLDALRLIAYFMRELMYANFKVAADVFRRDRIAPAVVAVPLDVKSDEEILLLSMLINITPGSVTIDLSDDRKTLYVHVMHVEDVEETRRNIKAGFEQRVRVLFGSADG